jgi:hypothetical protein
MTPEKRDIFRIFILQGIIFLTMNEYFGLRGVKLTTAASFSLIEVRQFVWGRSVGKQFHSSLFFFRALLTQKQKRN